ncbi:UDPglucose 6-dehydrogenase [Candidatus Hakubella thermalkaliphila]|uniref:UDP-glucose 6-dehydrogenase n=5 Tax=Candidatus Hakubella thermalkaliphila TaxID=2754717 RepID=A0A6V8PRR7_9ACTN|nr:UDP-glucose/GDP-mannose dehydrogenase family protein [Candidatus Hakubella thermalkaliphila]GFP34494.1 UDPglucose 6-dehydrogenase [Candidatus Hakubella thermalkaliphila]
MDKFRIGIIGTGYVGLVTGACLSDMGHTVYCMDIDEKVIKDLKSGQLPIYEPGLAELVAQGKERGNLFFTTYIEEVTDNCEIIYLAVGTPQSLDGGADLSQIYEAARSIRDSASRHTIVVTKSTVPVGTGGGLQHLLAEREDNEVSFSYVSNPEFLREGSAIKDFLEPDRIIIGSSDEESLDKMESIYRPLGVPMVRTDVKSAEMIKYASNAFLATKISFINEIANVCEEVGADIDVVAQGMGMDKRIGTSFLKAGIGYGGSCFPKDVQALKQLAGNTGYVFQLLNSVIEVNNLQKSRMLVKIKKKLGGLYGATIGLWGLSFKPNTDDIREASSLVLIKLLLNEGVKVKAYDPVAMEKCRLLYKGVHCCQDPYQVAEGCDALILVTEWDCFLDLDYTRILKSMNRPYIFDGRNALEHLKLRALGFEYEGVGRK